MSRLSPALAVLGAAVVLAPSQARTPPKAPAGAPAAMRVSLYYVAVEGDYPAGRDGVFLDARGRVLYRSSKAFLAAASVEGSARTAGGRSLAFDPENPRGGWAATAQPYGLDALGCPLVPYRTAAAPSWMPLGTRLYIPETVGLPLPNGARHDGYWYATDRGVGIEATGSTSSCAWARRPCARASGSGSTTSSPSTSASSAAFTAARAGRRRPSAEPARQMPV